MVGTFAHPWLLHGMNSAACKNSVTLLQGKAMCKHGVFMSLVQYSILRRGFRSAENET